MVLGREQLGKLAEALEGIPVWGCLPDSPATRAGMRYGDIVLAVNGKRTREMRDYVDARLLHGEFADVLVFREGGEHLFRLDFDTGPTHPGGKN